jgi:hypothetical protein
MKNPHRLYEIDDYAKVMTPKDNSFLDDFKLLVEQCLEKSPRLEGDPRLSINMSPEPYRPDSKIEMDPDSLRRRALDLVEPDLYNWEWLYKNLRDRDSRRTLVLVLAYRSLGWRYVKLPLDNDRFRGAVNEIGHFIINKAPGKFASKGLTKFNLSDVGRDVTVYSDSFGIFNEFIYPQYHYRGFYKFLAPQAGDYIIDCGACYGGTTLNFADLAGPEGRVYSFEFMPENIEVFQANVHANPRLQNRISLHDNPVWSDSGPRV